MAQRGMTTEAVKHFAEALRIDPGLARTHYNLGFALEKQSKDSEAIEHYRQALKLDNDLFKAHFHLAALLAGQDQYAQAVKHYRQVLRIRPALPIALKNLGWILATCDDSKIRDGAEAIRLAQRACQKPGDKAAKLDVLAAGYAETGQFSKAVTTARKALMQAANVGKKDLVYQIQHRIELYRSSQPYRQGSRGNAGH